MESYSDDDEPEADDDSDEVVDQSNTINLDKGWNNEEQSLCLSAANLVKVKINNWGGAPLQSLEW